MKRTFQGFAASFAAIGVLSLAACDRQSSGDHLDDAGEHLRDAAESTGDAVENAAEEARDEIEDLGDD
jgi:hypothetical protein